MKMTKRILLLNGPNLNLLGTREPHIYRTTSTLSALESSLQTFAASLGASLDTFQSNHEGALIDRIHAARDNHIDAIIINPGGLTHNSVALRDALLAVEIPFVEVHVSNVHAREEFRHRSFLSDKAAGVVVGLGTYGYRAAVEFVVCHLLKGEKENGKGKEGEGKEKAVL